MPTLSRILSTLLCATVIAGCDADLDLDLDRGDTSDAIDTIDDLADADGRDPSGERPYGLAGRETRPTASDSTAAPTRDTTRPLEQPRGDVRLVLCDLAVQDCPTGQVCRLVTAADDSQAPACVELDGPETISDVPEAAPIVKCDLAAQDCPSGQACRLVTLADDGETSICVELDGPETISDVPDPAPIVPCDLAAQDCPTGQACRLVTLADDSQATACVSIDGPGEFSDAP